MPERATLYQVTQLGVEATPGTAVAANRLLQSISIEPGISADISTFRPNGGKFATVAALGKEFTEAKISGAPTYDELTYLLAGLLVKPTPVQVTPPSGLAYRWTFTPNQSGPDTIATYTVEQGSSVRAQKFAYGLVSELTLSFSRDEVSLDGSMIGQAIQDGITMTASPTAIAIVPVLPTQIDAYLDSTAGGIGTTRLTRLLSAELKISDRFGSVWPLDSTQASYAAHVETAPTAELTMRLEADAQGMALLSAMRQGQRRYVRLRATGPTIEGATNYMLTIDLCGTVSDVGDYSDEDGVYAIEWTLQATYDGAWGKALTVELVNQRSTL